MIDESHLRTRRDRALGLYVHVPFCHTVCPYCDFAVTAQKARPHREYSDAIRGELVHRGGALQGRMLSTVYFGGGTPSLWAVAALADTLDAIRSEADVTQVEEVTLEANPKDIDSEKLQTWHELGVQRLSLGVQSFQDSTLKTLGRNHNGVQAREVVEEVLSDGRFALSIDLMYAVPGQSERELDEDLEILAAFPAIGHVSAYQLTIEPRTPFARQLTQGVLSVPSDDTTFALGEHMRMQLHALGYEQYEVSSFARANQQSRHNTLYWTGAEYMGLGVGAHSLCITGRFAERSQNTRHLALYLDAYGTGGQGNPPRSTDRHARYGKVTEREELSPLEHFVERLFLGIRCEAGLHWEELQYQFEWTLDPIVFERAARVLDRFVGHGILRTRPSPFSYVPTAKGFWLLDEVAGQLVRELLK